MERPDALSVGLRVAAAFDAAAIPYALGGALAYGLWGVPRATNDVYVNTFVEPEDLDRVFAVLQSLGATLTPETARSTATNEGMFMAHLNGFRLDVFTPSIAFSWEAQRTRVRHTIDGQEAWFLSAEVLSVFKLLFFRGKDIVDLERLIAVQGQRLDAAYVRRSIVDMMGGDDERVRTWDTLVTRFAGSP